jgi:hypothetical protein
MMGEHVPNGDVSELLMVRFTRGHLKTRLTPLPRLAGRCLIHQSVLRRHAGWGAGGHTSS